MRRPRSDPFWFGLKRLEQRKGAWLSRALRSDGGCKKRKEEEEEEEEK